MAPPPPATPGPVCCMCGDPGLAGELFRCRCCRARLQHSYCSDRYPSPRAAAYRRCNWCLREPQPADQAGRAGAGHATAATRQPVEKRKAAVAAYDEERGCWPRRSPPELGGPPVKKRHKAEDKLMPPPPPPSPGAGKEIVTTDAGGGGGGKEVMRAGKARLSRVKVRRYKLLTEVISC